MNSFSQDKLAVTMASIRERRSIYPKHYTGEIIPDEVILKLLESTRWAPTHKLTQPWRFKIYRGESLKKLSTFLAGKYSERYGESGLRRVREKERFELLMRASHILLIILHKNEKKVVPEWEEIAAVACAVQNLWISTSAAGYGCYWSTTRPIMGKPAIVDLKKNEECLGMFFIGNHHAPSVVRKRKEVVDIAEFI